MTAFQAFFVLGFSFTLGALGALVVAIAAVVSVAAFLSYLLRRG